MKPYVFAIGIILMLSFSLTGIACSAALIFRGLRLPCGPMAALWCGIATLVSLVWALAWSVPMRGGV